MVAYWTAWNEPDCAQIRRHLVAAVIEDVEWNDPRDSFVGITDHNVALDEDTSGKDKSSVLILGGEEVSLPDGHVLVMGVKKGWREGVPKETAAILAAAKKAGAARFLAHPFGASKDWANWRKLYAPTACGARGSAGSPLRTGRDRSRG